MNISNIGKMKCKGCKIDQDKNPYKERLYLTPDGYCTVCNVKYKDRERTKSIFEFKTIHKSNYDHYDKYRSHPSTKSDRIAHKFEKHWGYALKNHLIREYKSKLNKKMDEYI